MHQQQQRPLDQNIGVRDNHMIVITAMVKGHRYSCTAGMGIPDEAYQTWRRCLQSAMLLDGPEIANLFTPEYPIKFHLVKQLNTQEKAGEANKVIVTAQQSDGPTDPASKVV